MPENICEEIIDGVSHIMPFPSFRHALLITFLTNFLTAMAGSDFFVTCSPFGLGIRKKPSFTYRGPDLAVFSHEAISERQDDLYAWVAPELLVECLSPSNRKASVAKLIENYESIGTPELWLIYPESQNVEVYRLNDGRLFMEQNITSGEIQPVFAKSGVPVEELWNAFNR